MDKKNNSGLLVGIVIGLVIALIIGGCLFVTGTVNFSNGSSSNNQQSGDTTAETNNQSNNQDTVSTNNIFGEYYYISDDEIKHERVLDLMKDGTFYYYTGATCFNIGSGKYEKSGNKLILNFNFIANCGGSVYMNKNSVYSEEINVNSENINKKLEYVINADNTISIPENNNMKLEKINETYEKNYYYNDMLISAYATRAKQNNN